MQHRSTHTKFSYINYIDNLLADHAVKYRDMRNQRDCAQKRNVKLEGDIKTIAENKAKCDKFKKETDAILEGY
jgi:hypothetical protein